MVLGSLPSDVNTMNQAPWLMLGGFFYAQSPSGLCPQALEGLSLSLCQGCLSFGQAFSLIACEG